MPKPTESKPHVSGEIKQILLREFLKKHSLNTEEEVGYTYKNGRIVFDRIDEVSEGAHKRIQHAAKQKDAFLKDIPLSELSKDQDERYESCATSAKNSKRIVESLFSANLPSFSLVEKNDALVKIRRIEAKCSDNCQHLLEKKNVFLKFIEDDTLNPAYSIIKTTTIELLEATVGLIRNQCSLLKIEADLSNAFTGYSQNYIAQHLKDLKSKTKPDTWKSIAQVYKYLMRDGNLAVKDMSDLSYDEFQKVMLEFGGELDKKRLSIAKLEKIVKFIEQVIESMKAQAEQSQSDSAETTQPDDKKPRQGMSVMGRIKDRIGGLFKR